MSAPTPFERLADFAKKQTELDLAKAMLKSVVLSSAALDKAASLLLAGIGATAGLVISNLDKTANILDRGSIKAVLLLLIFGALFGLLQKYMAMRLQMQLAIESEIEKSFGAVLKYHSEQEVEIAQLSQGKDQAPETAIDFASVVRVVETVVPWYQKRIFKKGIRTGSSDRLSGQKLMASFYNRQVAYATIEFVLAVSAISVVAISI